MRTRVEKCSGGVAVVVPEEVAARAGLRGGEPADLEVVADRLVVRPVVPATLAELLAGITPENLHDEEETLVQCPALRQPTVGVDDVCWQRGHRLAVTILPPTIAPGPYRGPRTTQPACSAPRRGGYNHWGK